MVASAGAAAGDADRGESAGPAAVSAAGARSRLGAFCEQGRAGEALFCAGAGLALIDVFLRRDPPCGGTLRQRLALQSAAASARLLRLRADQGALRDLGFALAAAPAPAARLLSLWRGLAGRPPALDAPRLNEAAAALDLPLPDPETLAAALRECVREEDPVSAAAKAAAVAFAAFPDGPAAEAEIFAFWVFDLVLALRLRWERTGPLIATKILDLAVRLGEAGRRPKPAEPGWAKTATAALALAAAAALDLAAELCRRSEILLAVAPKLRAKPASRVVNLLLAEDCVSAAEAARDAPMTDRAARRLFDRLLTLGAVRELSGRPTFRIFGL